MKKIILILLFTTFFVSSCKNEENPIAKKFYKTTVVQSGSIEESESYVWYAESFHEVMLSPKVWWKIVSLLKEVWERVQSGDIVAILDSSEAKTGYHSSQDIIQDLLTLKESTNDMFDSQIQAMQEKIQSAKTGIDMAEIGVIGSTTWTQDTKNTIEAQIKTIESQIQTAVTGLESAQLQLENTKDTLETKEQDIYNNSKNALSQGNILATNIFNFIDEIFGVTQKNKYKNDNFEIYLSAKNITLKTEVENEINTLLIEFENLKKSSIDSKENINITLGKYHSFFSENLRNLLEKSYSALDNSIEWSALSANTLQTYKSTLTQFQNQNEQIILSVSGNYFLGLKGSLDSIASFAKEKKQTLDMMEKQVELAQKQVYTLQQTKNQIESAGNGQITDITTKSQIAQKQKTLSENNLNEALAGLEALKKQKQASLAQIDTQISQIKSWQNQSSVMIENGKVISLIDGIVTQKYQEVGNVIGAGMPIFSLASDDNIKIEVSTPENLLWNIQIGTEVKIEIEWVNEIKTGSVAKILPTRDIVSKKTNIEITLKNEKKDIKIGSYSKVYFDTQMKSDGIIIPNSSIVSDFMVSQVFIINKKKATLIPIKIIKQNDNFSQVEWISVGTTIISEWKENILDGEVLNN